MVLLLLPMQSGGLQWCTVLPVKVEMLLPGGCKGWPGSRGAVLPNQELGADGAEGQG